MNILDRHRNKRVVRKYEKARKKKQDQRRAMLLLGALLIALAVAGGISAAVGKSEPALVVKTVEPKTVEPGPRFTKEEIDEIMQKPIHELTEKEKIFATEKMAEAAMKGLQDGLNQRDKLKE